MRSRFYLVIVSAILLFAMGVNMTGCSTAVSAENLMEGFSSQYVKPDDNGKKDISGIMNFAVNLFKKSDCEGENTLISPLSVLCALSMTANGAKGETLEQMESVLGMSVDELNRFIHSYMDSIEKNTTVKFNIANSIWFKDSESFTANEDFLQLNSDYYGAEVYKSAFDNKTLSDINNWVKKETDGMIPKILQEISPDAVMFLINALAFDAEWVDIYLKNSIKNGNFTCENGSKIESEFMYGQEGVYLEDEDSVGFIKYYKGRKYAFAALLPNEGISISDYVDSLTGDRLYDILNNRQYVTVNTSIPKFETEYSTNMNDILTDLGMTDAFNMAEADFSGLGRCDEYNILIGNVIHKTFISVNERGTRAGAATVVEMRCGSAAPTEPKYVYLNRPFVYMLIDCETNYPFFIGSMNDLRG